MSGVDVMQQLRADVRARYGRLTPFRMGVVAGEQGLAIPNPYTTWRGRQWFDDGVEFGKAHAVRAAGGAK